MQVSVMEEIHQADEKVKLGVSADDYRVVDGELQCIKREQLRLSANAHG